MLSFDQFNTKINELQQPKVPKPKKGNILTNLLPALGGIGGGLLGAPLGPAGIIAGSAAGSGAGDFLRQKYSGQEGADLGSIGKEAIMGGFFSAGGLGVGKAIGALRGGGAAAKGGAPGVVKQKLFQSYVKSTPTAYNNALQAGIDINKVGARWMPKLAAGKSAGFDDVLAGVESELKAAEKVVQQGIKAAGKTQKISGDTILKALTGELKKIKGSTDLNRTSALKEIIAQQASLYRNGITQKKALSLVRQANEKFGRSIFDEGTGSVAASADKTIANALRNTLKRMNPKISQGLDAQHELLTLKPVLEAARAGTRSGSLGKGLNIFNPVGIAEKVVSSPKVGGRVLAGKGVIPTPKIPKIPGGGKIAGGIATQVLPRAGGILGSGQEPLPPELQNGQTAPDIQTGEMSNNVTQPLISREEAIQMILDNPKNASAIAAAYKIGAEGSGPGKPLTAQQQTNRDNALSGLEAVGKLESELRRDPNQIFLAAIPGSPGARTFVAARNEAADVLTRLRTGAALNEEEQRFYSNQLPQPFDSQATILYKIGLFKKLFARKAQQQGAAGISASDLPDQLQQ